MTTTDCMQLEKLDFCYKFQTTDSPFENDMEAVSPAPLQFFSSNENIMLIIVQKDRSERGLYCIRYFSHHP